MFSRQKSLGITITAVILLILGILHIVATILTWEYLILENPLFLLIRLIFPTLYIIVAFALLQLRHWALEVSMIICIFQMIINAISVVGYLTRFGYLNIRSIEDILDIVIYFSIYIILSSKKTKLQFHS